MRATTKSQNEEIHFKALRLLEVTPKFNQRNLAVALGISLGKANFCLKALVDKGLLKMENFRSNQNKLSYAYLLTPKGIAAKAVLTKRFLKRKTEEYELLKAEIELLQRQADTSKTVIPSPRA